jgi:hypothetical protein
MPRKPKPPPDDPEQSKRLPCRPPRCRSDRPGYRRAGIAARADRDCHPRTRHRHSGSLPTPSPRVAGFGSPRFAPSPLALLDGFCIASSGRTLRKSLSGGRSRSLAKRLLQPRQCDATSGQFGGQRRREPGQRLINRPERSMSRWCDMDITTWAGFQFGRSGSGSRLAFHSAQRSLFFWLAGSRHTSQNYFCQTKS